MQAGFGADGGPAALGALVRGDVHVVVAFGAMQRVEAAVPARDAKEDDGDDEAGH